MLRPLLPVVRLVWRNDDVALRPVAVVSVLYALSFATF
jgi:hypothetical protein